MNNTETCNKFCDIHGEYEASRFFMFTSWSSWSRCLLCQEDDDRTEKNKSESDLCRKIIESSGIPKRFLSLSDSSYVPKNTVDDRNYRICIKYAIDFNKNLEIGVPIIMHGNTGTGKTHLSCLIARNVILMHKKYAKFTTAHNMFSFVKSSFNKEAGYTDMEAVSSYTVPDLLVIDDVGVQFCSSTERMIMFQVINGRYENRLPTIITTNLCIERLIEVLGERCFDRLNEHAHIMHFNWESNRKSMRQTRSIIPIIDQREVYGTDEEHEHTAME